MTTSSHIRVLLVALGLLTALVVGFYTGTATVESPTTPATNALLEAHANCMAERTYHGLLFHQALVACQP